MPTPFDAHFRGKAEIAGAVAFRIAEEVVRQLNLATAHLDEATAQAKPAAWREIPMLRLQITLPAKGG